MESNFQKDLQESEMIFKKMFDPNSVLFHNGDPTPVPIGGQRIPSSMPTPYKIEETIEKKIEYGTEYEHHQEMREFFNLVKKVYYYFSF